MSDEATYEISWDGETWQDWPMDHRMPGPAECRYVRKKPPRSTGGPPSPVDPVEANSTTDCPACHEIVKREEIHMCNCTWLPRDPVEAVLAVECPWCGAKPESVCRFEMGPDDPSADGAPFHASRIRTALTTRTSEPRKETP